MKILPPSQIKNLPIMEDVLEELRLNVIDHIQQIAEALDLYSLDTANIKRKLNLLGLSNINIGKFIKLDLNSDEFEFISPEFYKMYRKLNQHRGNKMSMDYIFHSAGMMNTLVHSNTQSYSQSDIFGNTASFFEFNTYRDNQLPDLEIGDGYIIVPYSSNRLQTLKQYLAKNPIIFSFLPAGYTFIFLSEYRNGYDNGVHQYDNILDYRDNQTTEYYYTNPETGEVEVKSFVYEDPITHEIQFIDEPYQKPVYWEIFDQYHVDEDIQLSDGSIFTYTHTVYYYDPFLWRDKGFRQLTIYYPRFTCDDLYYIIPKYIQDYGQFHNLDEYLNYYSSLLLADVLEKYKEGYEQDLNNTLFYKDIWLGDYLVSCLNGENRYPSYFDHVKGLQAIQAPTYSYASLYQRGESLASQYFQREEKIISTADTLIQEHKKEIISDRRELDLFKYFYSTDAIIRLDGFYDESVLRSILQSVFSFDTFAINYIIDRYNNYGNATIRSGIDVTEAIQYFEDIISTMHTLENQYCNDIIISVIVGGNLYCTNDANHTTDPSRFPRNIHVDTSENETAILSGSSQFVKISLSASFSGIGTETLYLGQNPQTLDYLDLD